jgi:DNA polymerase III subunit epsilon
MSFWSRLRGRRVTSDPALRARVDGYLALDAPPAAGRLEAARFVVVDVETSGLNPYRDRLIAIGALAMDGGLLRLGAGMEVVLRQDRPSEPANILVHGIDGTTQVGGQEPACALMQFLEFAGKSPLVGYHADFDRVMLARAAKSFLGIEPANEWLDVARLAPALVQAQLPPGADLDDWAGAHGIVNPARHNAMADAMVTAQLFQIVLASANSRGIVSYAALRESERGQRGLEQFQGRPG